MLHKKYTKEKNRRRKRIPTDYYRKRVRGGRARSANYLEKMYKGMGRKGTKVSIHQYTITYKDYQIVSSRSISPSASTSTS